MISITLKSILIFISILIVVSEPIYVYNKVKTMMKEDHRSFKKCLYWYITFDHTVRFTLFISIVLFNVLLVLNYSVFNAEFIDIILKLMVSFVLVCLGTFCLITQSLSCFLDRDKGSVFSLILGIVFYTFALNNFYYFLPSLKLVI